MCISLGAVAAPASLPSHQIVPGQDPLYSDYRGKAPPYPAHNTSPILPSTTGFPGPDDLLFQNLLAAEWVVFSLYQYAVETFNQSAFVAAGFPNTTYDRVSEIRDNEAGRLLAFQNSISSTSVKPGPCKYTFADLTTPEEWLAVQTLVEVSSMAFLTGLVQEAKENVSRVALLAIAATESRHNTWALVDIWKTNPFASPTDTVFPYAEQILSTTQMFVVDGSCPIQNPPYPTPDQHLPQLDFDREHEDGTPGSKITFTYSSTKPVFRANTTYHAVFFYSLSNISVPFDAQTGKATIPDQFERNKGIIIAVIADKEVAPTRDSVVAGPLFLLEQSSLLTRLV